MPVDETRHLSRVPPLEVDKVTVILVQGYPAFTLAEEEEDERRRCKAEVERATVWNDNLQIDELAKCHFHSNLPPGGPSQ